MVLSRVQSPDSLFEALRSRSLIPKKECLEAFANLMKFGVFPAPLFPQDEKKQYYVVVVVWRK